MAAYSGKDGKVLIGSTAVANVTAWTWNSTSNNPSFASNETGGYKTRTGGVKDATGTISCKLDGTPQTGVLSVGTTATLILHTDSSQTVTQPAIVDSLSITTDVDNGEYVTCEIAYSSTGAPTLSL